MSYEKKMLSFNTTEVKVPCTYLLRVTYQHIIFIDTDYIHSVCA